MSVIVRTEDGEILFMCKGADRSVRSELVSISFASFICYFAYTNKSLSFGPCFLCQVENIDRGYPSPMIFEENYVLCSRGSILMRCLDLCSIILERLAESGRVFVEATVRHLNEFGEAGLRTLAVACKKLEESKYLAWNAEFSKAKTTIGADRENLLEHAAELMEKDLSLVGATAVEDKLQKGVYTCPVSVCTMPNFMS